MRTRRGAVIIPSMGSLLRHTAACFAALLAFAAAPRAGEVQPRSHAWLLSHATLVVAGTVESVSSGLFGDGRSATIRVDGLVKGRWNRREIRIAWNDKEFEETAYQKDNRVVVFAVLRKDSSFSQAAPGVSCWPVERAQIGGKASRAVEYAYPLDLLTDIPAAALKTTESVEKSMNFRMAQRKQWILVEKALPPIRPFVVPKPPPPRKPAAKVAAKPKPRASNIR